MRREGGGGPGPTRSGASRVQRPEPLVFLLRAGRGPGRCRTGRGLGRRGLELEGRVKGWELEKVSGGTGWSRTKRRGGRRESG